MPTHHFHRVYVTGDDRIIFILLRDYYTPAGNRKTASGGMAFEAKVP
jgi:hypothetical protein